MFEKAIKEDQLSTKYKNLIQKAYQIPDTLCYFDFINKRVSADIRLVGVRYQTIPDSLVNDVSEDELEELYNEKKHSYEQEPSRDLNYVIFEVEPSPDDRQKVNHDVYAIFEDFKVAENVPLFVNTTSDNSYDSTFFKEGELDATIDSVMFNSEAGSFYGPYMENDIWHIARLMDIQYRPDSMKASHILIAFTGALRAAENVTRTKEEAEQYADSILNIVKANPGRIEDLAKEVSNDPSSEQNSGDLGWFADGSMVYPFNQAVLEGKIGDVTMVETMFGYHIIKITDKKEPVKKVRVAMVDREISPSNQTYQDEYAEASRFSGMVKDIISFDTLAENLAVNVRQATYLAPMGYRIAGLDYPRPVIQWSHQDGIAVGSVSPVFTFEDKYVVAIITKAREKGFAAIEDIEPTLTPLLKKNKKGDYVIENINTAIEQSSDIKELATILESKVDTMPGLNFNSRALAGGYGMEPKFVAKVMELEEGQMFGPIRGDNSGFIVIIDKINYPAETENTYTYKQQLVNNFTSRINNNQYLTTLEKQANIEDNRVMFY
ncbi:MAG: peptidylprolyl isomerase [Bacteroidales bacterium]|nr:peptidylprolyl isomerase [Bacteroidales bacterium]